MAIKASGFQSARGHPAGEDGDCGGVFERVLNHQPATGVQKESEKAEEQKAEKQGPQPGLARCRAGHERAENEREHLRRIVTCGLPAVKPAIDMVNGK